MKKSILFPGQGSQFTGMGLDFYNNFKIAKDVFNEVDETLNINLSKIIFEDQSGLLNLTENTQPAIMATGVAIFRVLKETNGIKMSDFHYCAGHSLGEYTALVCSDALSLKNASLILRERGKAMQTAVKPGEGAMAAVLGSEIAEIENLILDLNFSSVEISNDNCPGQLVISGKKDEVEKCCLEIKNKISKKSIVLPVSATFHCKLMKQASEIMKEMIMNIELNSLKTPIISNVNVHEITDSNLIKNLLIDQIYKKVRWREIIERMLKKNVLEFVEIGPGKTLSGMLKRFKKDIVVRNFNSIQDVDS